MTGTSTAWWVSALRMIGLSGTVPNPRHGDCWFFHLLSQEVCRTPLWEPRLLWPPAHIADQDWLSRELRNFSECRQCLSTFTVLLSAGNRSSLHNSMSCLKFLNYLCPSNLGDYSPSTATTRLLEPKFSGLWSVLQSWFIWMFEKGRSFEGENGMVHRYLLGMVNRKGNPIPNVEMYYTAYSLYKYRRQVLDHAEEGLSKNATFTRR